MNSAFFASFVHRSCIFRKLSHILCVTESYGPPVTLVLINVSQELSGVWEWGSRAFPAGDSNTKSLPGGPYYYPDSWEAGTELKQVEEK